MTIEELLATPKSITVLGYSMTHGAMELAVHDGDMSRYWEVVCEGCDCLYGDLASHGVKNFSVGNENDYMSLRAERFLVRYDRLSVNGQRNLSERSHPPALPQTNVSLTLEELLELPRWLGVLTYDIRARQMRLAIHDGGFPVRFWDVVCEGCTYLAGNLMLFKASEFTLDRHDDLLAIECDGFKLECEKAWIRREKHQPRDDLLSPGLLERYRAADES